MVRDELTKEQIEQFKGTILKSGKPYLWVLGFGWGIIGFYIEHINPIKLRIAHANHFRNAGKDYGRLATEGAGDDCEWRYEGNVELIETNVQRVIEYLGKVNKIRTSTHDD